MTATLTTKQIKDGNGSTFDQRVLDVSGIGEGPFLPLHGLSDPDGVGPIDLAALTGAIVSAIEAQKTGSASDPNYGVGLTKVATASLTRPADTTAYAPGDLIANSATAGSVTPLTIAAARANDATGMVRKARLSTSNVGWANNTVRVHLFKNTPTSSAGDNVAFSGAVNGIAAVHLGYIDVTFDQTFSDGVKGEGIPNAGSEINFDPASGTPNIYALLESRGSYTPTSGQTFALAVETLQN